MMQLPDLTTAQLSGKKVLLRADLDVPLSKTGAIDDPLRLEAAMETLGYLQENHATIIIAGHLGRPEKKYGVGSIQYGEEEKKDSLAPVAHWFTKNIIHNSEFKIQKERVGEFEGWKVAENVFLLENLRFYAGEEANGEQFAKQLASLADIYVNDAFTVAHRKHASVAAITTCLPHYAGLHLQKEVSVLGGILENPKRPLVVIIGGAKIETKLPMVTVMLQHADHVLVGGKLLLEGDKLKEITDEKLVLANLSDDKFDITEESVQKFIDRIHEAAMIVWNGPVGLIDLSDDKDTERGTREIAQAVVASKAYKIIGGGDTLDYVKSLGLTDKFDFCSLGGGAMLAFLSGEPLPALESLRSS